MRTLSFGALALSCALTACATTYVPSRPRLVPGDDLDTRISIFQRHRLQQSGGWLLGYEYWNLANPQRNGEWPDAGVLFQQFDETKGTLLVSQVLGVIGNLSSALGTGLGLTGAICMSGGRCFGHDVDVALLATGIALEFLSSALSVASRTLYGDLGDAYNAALFDQLGLGAPATAGPSAGPRRPQGEPPSPTAPPPDAAPVEPAPPAAPPEGDSIDL